MNSFSSPHVMSLIPAGGGGNIGSYRNANSSNQVGGGGAPGLKESHSIIKC